MVSIPAVRWQTYFRPGFSTFIITAGLLCAACMSRPQVESTPEASHGSASHRNSKADSAFREKPFSKIKDFKEVDLPDPKRLILGKQEVDEYVIAGHHLERIPHDLLSVDGKYCAYSALSKQTPKGVGSIYILRLSDWSLWCASVGNNNIKDIAFSNDSKEAALSLSSLSVADDQIIFVQLDKWKQSDNVLTPILVLSLIYSNNSKDLIVGGHKAPVLKVDIESRLPVLRYSESLSIREIDSDPTSDYFAAGFWDGTVRLWNYAGDREIVLPKTKYSNVEHIDYVPHKNQILVSYINNPVLLWDLDTLKSEYIFSRKGNPWFTGEQRHVEHIDVSEDGTKVLFSVAHGEIVYFDLENRKEIASFELPRKVWTCAAEFMKDENTVLILCRPDTYDYDYETFFYVWHLPEIEQEARQN